MKVFLNDAYLEEDAALISPLSPGFMYGYGVFETIRVSGKQALFLDQHHTRMVLALSVLGMTSPYQETELQPIIDKLLDLNGVSEGFVKVVCSKTDSKMQHNQEADILILTGTKTYKEEYATGLKVCLADARRNEFSKIVGIKSMNYTENILEKEAATKRGFDDAIFLNTHDHVAEGCVSNVFWVKDGIVYTPSLDCGILEGTARGRVIHKCTELQIPVREGTYRFEELFRADEMFLTNALMDVMPVSILEDKNFNIGAYQVVPQLRKNRR
ncbi:aminotransferase class IV [Trichococcus collinsii]|uniref:4-amino-4-deoxychorismate lyase n=1 Tax=Trichococcus collinsii TaxID=157076 RepID=A0AB37ZZK3_9LACT|nr:aminotransferase class IV [Trichococcus collinsii]CZR06500.1 aminotransferase class iv [Trichococcus collinsii]SEA32142.1 4-amino-4-deoxychorismate lyase [Trichococcus collinsii]